MDRTDDTIYALATPLGNGVAVVRISGPMAESALRSVFGKKGEFKSHMLYHGLVTDGDDAIDDAMAVLMRAPGSYTGEDVAELHIHGSPAVARRVLELLSRCGLRQAERGEFTRRAFVNGKLDLSAAEAVMDLVSASAQDAAKAALSQLRGSLSRKITRLQEELTDCIARTEAGIDYPEEDWEEDIADELIPPLTDMAKKLDALIASGARGKIMKDGLRVALCGRPNVGKSTLLNSLLGENRAIVTATPGTTRDIIEEVVDWNGLLVRLIDTAGLRESTDEVEKIGVDLARNAMKGADLVLLLFDGASPLCDDDKAVLDEAANLPALAVITKGDLPPVISAADVEAFSGLVTIPVSATEEGGLNALKTAVYSYFESLAPVERTDSVVTNRRHLDALVEAAHGVKSAIESLDNLELDCASIDMRHSWRALGEISGQTVDEVIVDRIFEKFCLGK